MTCCWRSTVAVLIGALNIVIYMGICIVMIQMYQESNNNSVKYKIVVYLIVIVSIIMSLVSGLLIWGAIKRAHKLMWPWLVLSAFVFICNCIKAIASLIISLINGIPFHQLILSFVIDVLALGIQALLVWPIYSLSRVTSAAN